MNSRLIYADFRQASLLSCNVPRGTGVGGDTLWDWGRPIAGRFRSDLRIPGVFLDK